MKSKTLKQANAYLRADDAAARSMRIRSIASSTAIETGKPITAIEELITKKRSRYRVTLA